MNECSVFWCGKYCQQWETDIHNHTYFQLFGISEGNGRLLVENETFDILPQQLYLIRPQQNHAVLTTEREPLHILDIKFSVHNQDLFEELLKIDKPFAPKNFSWFTQGFEKIFKESQEQQIHYYSIVCNTLYELLVRIIRERNGDVSAPSTVPVSEPPVREYRGINVAALMDYIRFNYTHIISLDDLSAAAHVNKTTLSNMFKELFDTTPIRYINSLRMQKAKELLSNTTIGIGEIAELIGFQSIHYFSRFFKEKENCTPVEYRMRHSQNRYFYFP